jgi:hypothetical protein
LRYSIVVLAAVVGGSALALSGRAEGEPAIVSSQRWHRSSMTAPLQVDMEPLPQRKGDARGQRRLRLRVTPSVDAAGLEVKLVLPPEVRLAQGEVRWQAPARANVTQTRELLFMVPNTGEQRVVATARLVFQRSLPMARTVAYRFNPTAAPRRPKGELQEPEVVPMVGKGAPSRGQ